MHQIQRYFRKAGKAILRFFGRVAHGSVLDIAILVCGVGVVGVGTTIAVVASQRPAQLPVDVSSAVPMSVSAPASIPPASSEAYDPNENALQLSEYDGTLLAETTDGGDAYLKETIFIGDSNTYRLATYSLTSWQNNLSAVGMGIQHVTSTPSMYFKGMSNPVYMARAVAMMQPRRIVITYGTNNTDSPAETFKNQYRSALEAIKKEWPYADIIINAIPPVAIFRPNAAATQKSIDAFNKALADLAREDGYQFLNSSEALKDPTTGFARTDYMIGDGLHLNEDGAKALMSYVRTHTHVVADTRPALTELPVHQPTPEELFNPQAASSSSSSSSSSQAQGVTVRFFITKGQESFGTLTGTLTQQVEPGKACTPVTATANTGYSIVGWGCTEGGLYEGRGLSTVVNNQQTATFTVPGGTTLKELSVWVSFQQNHVHSYNTDDWKDQGNGTHAHWCKDGDKCPDENKGAVVDPHTWNKETGTCTVCSAACTHNWGATDTATGKHKCTVCGKEDTDSTWKPPHTTHTPSGSWVQGENTHWQTCTEPSCTEHLSEAQHTWNASHICTTCSKQNGQTDHSWDVATGTCTICQTTCSHNYGENGANPNCGICGMTNPNQSTETEP